MNHHKIADVLPFARGHQSLFVLQFRSDFQFRHLYQLVNPRGRYKYKSFDVLELWAEDVKEVKLGGGQ